jgi:hypothetical protein
VRRFLIFTVAALAFFVAAAATSAMLTRREARGLLDDLRTLSTSPDPNSSFHSLKQKYGTRLKLEACGPDTYSGRGPSAEACGYDTYVNNRLLAKLHLTPRTEMRLGFLLVNDSLEMLTIEYTSGIFKAESPYTFIQESFCSESIGPGGAFEGDESVPWAPCHHFNLYPHGRDKTPTWNGAVTFGYWATADQKHAALGLNLACLGALRGCEDISELLPTIWELTDSGAVSARLADSDEGVLPGY